VFRPGQKWWWSLLGREISCSTQGALLFFLLYFGGRGKRFFFELLMCSYHVPKLFPKDVPNSTWFQTQNPPLLTYIGGVFFARGISPGEKLWQTLLWREISSSQCEGPIRLSWCLGFFLLSLWGWGWWEIGGEFFFFSSCIWCGEWTVTVSTWTVNHPSFIGGGGGPRCLAFYSFSVWGAGRIFLSFSLFPNVFPRCSL
jgi:hypothetical protein